MKSTKIIAGLGVAAALGVAALPVATYAQVSYGQETTITATIADSLVVTINGAEVEAGGSAADATVAFTGVVAGKAYTKAEQTTIEVDTNFPGGYTLTVTPTALEQSGTSANFAVASTAFSATNDTASSDLDNSKWGMSITKTGGAAATGAWASLAAGSYLGGTADEANTIDSVATLATAEDNTYKVSYAINTKTGMPSGEYTGTATYEVTSSYTAPTPDPDPDQP